MCQAVRWNEHWPVGVWLAQGAPNEISFSASFLGLGWLCLDAVWYHHLPTAGMRDHRAHPGSDFVSSGFLILKPGG